jgi:hypothetical protein
MAKAKRDYNQFGPYRVPTADSDGAACVRELVIKQIDWLCK